MAKKMAKVVKYTVTETKLGPTASGYDSRGHIVNGINGHRGDYDAVLKAAKKAWPTAKHVEQPPAQRARTGNVGEHGGYRHTLPGYDRDAGARPALHDVILGRAPERENPNGAYAVQPSKALGELMSSWHSSGGDPVYAVSSHFFAGHSVPVSVAERAVANMQAVVDSSAARRKTAGWSSKDIAEAKLIVARLKKLIANTLTEARENPGRRMPAEAIDRNIQEDIDALEKARWADSSGKVHPIVPESSWGDVKTILSWLRGNEASMTASFFVGSMRKGPLAFRREFYIDDRHGGDPVQTAFSKGRIGKREFNKALVSLNAAQDKLAKMISPTWRPNPLQTGTKLIVGGVAIAATAAALLIGRSASAAPVLPGPQPPSNAPTAPPPETEIVITAPPPGSHPDAPPVEHVEPASGSHPAPEPVHVVPPPPRTATPPAPTTTPPVAGTPPHAGLVARLRSSDAARQVFAYQALAYEWLITGELPDGLMGPHTSGIIRSMDVQSSVVPSGNFRGRTSVTRLVDVVMRANAGSTPSPRLLPFTLPRAVISQVNATGTRIGSPILLQIHAA